ncbi:MAG: hypothetical protein LBR30_04195 [Clostridioides sp.]|jgi:hypothetical protein|nr:hypothetical protein [Clostridioides sp.]
MEFAINGVNINFNLKRVNYNDIRKSFKINAKNAQEDFFEECANVIRSEKRLAEQDVYILDKYIDKALKLSVEIFISYSIFTIDINTFRNIYLNSNKNSIFKKKILDFNKTNLSSYKNKKKKKNNKNEYFFSSELNQIDKSKIKMNDMEKYKNDANETYKYKNDISNVEYCKNKMNDIENYKNDIENYKIEYCEKKMNDIEKYKNEIKKNILQMKNYEKDPRKEQLKVYIETLSEFLYEEFFEIHYFVIDVLKSNGIISVGSVISDEDIKMAEALFNNYKSGLINKANESLAIKQIIELNPYIEDLYKFLIEEEGDFFLEIERLTEFLGYDIKIFKEELMSKYTDYLLVNNIDKTDDKIEKYAKFIGYKDFALFIRRIETIKEYRNA